MEGRKERTKKQRFNGEKKEDMMRGRKKTRVNGQKEGIQDERREGKNKGGKTTNQGQNKEDRME